MKKKNGEGKGKNGVGKLWGKKLKNTNIRGKNGDGVGKNLKIKKKFKEKRKFRARENTRKKSRKIAILKIATRDEKSRKIAIFLSRGFHDFSREKCNYKVTYPSGVGPFPQRYHT